ncbi:MAG: hypothetical protein ABJB47_16540, partial [Actinomycetota bacterium]
MAILPAALHAALRRRPFIAGWLSRGGGAPLELITNAGPLPPAAGSAKGGLITPAAGPGVQGASELLFPAGAHGVAMPGDWLTDLDHLVWAPCPARLALPLAAPGGSQPARRGGQAGQDPWAGSRHGGDAGPPSLFELTLMSLMARPF